MVTRVLAELDRLKGSDRYLAGPEISLADLFLAPIFAYLSLTPDAKELLEPTRGLSQWSEEISTRETMTKTQPKLG
jgi:glutathione S-transferase